MKRTFIIFTCFCLTLCISGCRNNVKDEAAAESFSVTKYSDATGQYYEEIDGYKAVLYEKDELGTLFVTDSKSIEKIESWLNSCEPGDGYHQYIYSDPDSWDMLIYYPCEYGKYSFRFAVAGTAVKVYVVDDDINYTHQADYILIRIQAPRTGVWASESELYVNGEKIKMETSAVY